MEIYFLYEYLSKTLDHLSAAEEIINRQEAVISELKKEINQKSVLLEKDETLQLTAVRLYHSQREVARYLELGYLNLIDHPDIAKEVRLTAYDARAQHLMTSGLMKKFTMTSKHVVQTLLPMIRDGVELQDADIVRDTFGQILDLAEDMKKESERTKASYYQIQGKVQKNLGEVDERNTTVMKTKGGVGLGDVQTLKEAATHLGDVDKLFTKIIKFWEDMAAATKYLKDDTKAGEVYLKKIEDERYQTRFLKSIERAEQNWGFFGQLCGAYVVETDKEIDFLYEYLSKPLDHLSAEERKNRKEAVLRELKEEIDQVYPQVEDITDEKDA
ncbi:uncharacterized protein LOC128219170 [Mya arenaria]|uniref:uncharacterized protein LOC128219170 n=1 Tax=Mya arenaria TaxID=6604 RepID=UPI0022E2B9A9|nr:uncharacterized protein LOC128219170 [Mya arenaria]